MAAHRQAVLEMLPRGIEVELLPVGRWWDAVKVPSRLGYAALELLAHESGAVIEDFFGSCLYWLVPPGTAAGWALPYISVLGQSCYLAVPPAHRTHQLGLRWLVPCREGQILTDPHLLHEALEATIPALAAPRGAS